MSPRLHKSFIKNPKNIENILWDCTRLSASQTILTLTANRGQVMEAIANFLDNVFVLLPMLLLGLGGLLARRHTEGPRQRAATIAMRIGLGVFLLALILNWQDLIDGFADGYVGYVDESRWP